MPAIANIFPSKFCCRSTNERRFATVCIWRCAASTAIR
ncbi:unnamed protein product [Ciceribacter selenitireducens ATCC BAA-1503]|uniref:Uncharacterized protein n=1 Tax=Ciceribacter selenitireducens ATCC BAA-1503 TaxID=1336235 RepID=A0A376AC29_9HYPH|nr:unnamed protein product [Ciceribacter selenitireducens ATCC BAA-1503]